MADFERLKLAGLLAEKRNEALQLKLKCECLRDSMRDYLPRHERIEDLRGDKILAIGVDLETALERYRDILVDIKAIELDLGV